MAWSIDDWRYVTRTLVTDPKGREWSIAVMDLLGQEGDPDMPNQWAEIEFASGRYYTLIYSTTGAVQWERGHRSLSDAMDEYERLLASVRSGRLDPSQPAFRDDLEDTEPTRPDDD
jgi:hypothetical protein